MTLERPEFPIDPDPPCLLCGATPPGHYTGCPDLEYPDGPPGEDLDDFDLVGDDVDEASASSLREWVELRLAGASECELRALAGDR